jgi:hypothetical protein
MSEPETLAWRLPTKTRGQVAGFLAFDFLEFAVAHADRQAAPFGADGFGRVRPALRAADTMSFNRPFGPSGGYGGRGRREQP